MGSIIDHRPKKQTEINVGDLLIIKGGIPNNRHHILVTEDQKRLGVMLLDLKTSKIVAYEDSPDIALETLADDMRDFQLVEIINKKRISVHIDYKDAGPIACSI